MISSKLINEDTQAISAKVAILKFEVSSLWTYKITILF